MSGAPEVLPGLGVPAHEVPDVLRRIVARRCERLGVAEVQLPVGQDRAGPLGSDAPGSDFLSSIREALPRAIIAEVKMGSPKLGSLEGRFDPERQAQTYRNGGASCLSVVVEPDFFFGSYELLGRCVAASGLPAIAKDFVVSEDQLDQAAAAGASAILLIAALYDATSLRRWAGAARARGLVPLVETHTATDTAKLDGADWEIVGVNNRDLRTFAVDLENSLQRLPELPQAALKVAESGISDRGAIDRLSAAGFGAFLIGESLLLADDPNLKLAELKGVQS